MFGVWKKPSKLLQRFVEFSPYPCYNCYIGVTLANNQKAKGCTIMDEELVILVEKLTDLHEKLGTWEKVGEHYELPKIVLWRRVNDGYDPRNNKSRRILGLSEIIEQKIRRDNKGRFARDIG